MMRFLYKFSITVLIVLILFLVYLSTVGLETDRFDVLIKNKANTVKENVKLDFNKTNIYLDIRDLKLLVKLKNPKIIIKNNEINLLKLNLYLPLKSFYKSDFLLERANIGFAKNSIKDLAKVTNFFLPKIINNQVKKFFVKGNLEGEFIIPFNPDGSIKEDYSFYGKIKNAKINIFNQYEVKDLNATIAYGETSNLNSDGLIITIENGVISNLKILKSYININFKGNKKHIKSSIHTIGDLNFQEIKKILSTLRYKLDILEDINFQSDIKTNFEFHIDKKFKITDQNYQIEGQIKNLYLKTKEEKFIKNFLPSFNSEIALKNARIKFLSTPKKQIFNLIGDTKFSNKYENLELNHVHNKKNKKHSIDASLTLNESLIEIKKLNYKKKVSEKAEVNFSGNFIKNKYFLIDTLTFFSTPSEIIIDKVKLNENFEIIDLNKIKIKTYSNDIINNDLLIIKSDKVKISGNVFDAQPLLKSLFNNEDRKTFGKKFSNDIKVNFKKTITGTGDDVSDLSMIGTIDSGSYQKLVLKGKFSKDEIVEMSVYQIDKDTKTVQVISDRARPFIKHFDFIEGFEGGKLDYESNLVKKKSSSNLTITDFKVSKVPALAKLLTLASLQGIADTLSGEGIRFDSFEMKSSSEGNVMNIEDILAMGPAVSILLDGYVDKGKTVSLRGTLVPATKLNSIIASIPLLGDILVGQKTGEGVVGVSFKMKGPPKNIKTSVNPIKTLTPRFIVRAVEKMKKKKEETK